MIVPTMTVASSKAEADNGDMSARNPRWWRPRSGCGCLMLLSRLVCLHQLPSFNELPCRMGEHPYLTTGSWGNDGTLMFMCKHTYTVFLDCRSVFATAGAPWRLILLSDKSHGYGRGYVVYLSAYPRPSQGHLRPYTL